MENSPQRQLQRASATASSRQAASQHRRAISHTFPIISWLGHYQRANLWGDLIAGGIVAIMLIPQGMAYAQLSELPPQVGLYASILPLILYALFGSSRALAVGPVAIVSLMVATSLGNLAQPNTPEYLALALVLAGLVGVLQVMMGVVRLGFLVNFLSHAVIAGFSSAAALLIGFSQVKHLLGIQIPQTESFIALMSQVIAKLPQTNPTTLAVGLTCLFILVGFRQGLSTVLRRLGIAPSIAQVVSKTGPLVVVLFSTLLVWQLGWNDAAQVKIVGEIPQGLPALALPHTGWERWHELLPTALTISFVGFLESVAVAKAIAAKQRLPIDANQELLGLGFANLGAAITGGYPVTGGLSRSMVNFTAGAKTGLASLFTALLVLSVVLFFTPLFYFLPQAALASIILIAVLALVDITTVRRLWREDRSEAVVFLLTFGAVLLLGVEQGIVVGAAASLGLYLWRTSHPHIAVVGRMGRSEQFRNVHRHPVQTCDHVLAVRVDGSLYFANSRYLEEQLIRLVAEHPQVKQVVLIGSGINSIDSTARETLMTLIELWKEHDITVYFTDFKGPVMDHLEQVGFVDWLGTDHVVLSTHQVMQQLSCP